MVDLSDAVESVRVVVETIRLQMEQHKLRFLKLLGTGQSQMLGSGPSPNEVAILRDIAANILQALLVFEVVPGKLSPEPWHAVAGDALQVGDVEHAVQVLRMHQPVCACCSASMTRPTTTLRTDATPQTDYTANVFVEPLRLGYRKACDRIRELEIVLEHTEAELRRAAEDGRYDGLTE